MKLGLVKASNPYCDQIKDMLEEWIIQACQEGEHD